MNPYIYAFLLFGACFGAASFPHRYLFSEGPKKVPDPPGGPTVSSRIFWVMVCTFLWPIMVLTGLNSAWILARRKRQSA